MFTVTDDQAAAICDAFEHGGEFEAAVEFRQLFPGITDDTAVRAQAKVIAGWASLPAATLRPVTRLRTGRSR